MSAPLSQRTFDAAIARRLPFAGSMIWLERAISGELGWVLTGWAIYLIAALFGIADWMNGSLRVIVLGALYVGTILLCTRAAWRITLPTRALRLARLERGSGLRRGTLALGTDRPAAHVSGLSEALWARARMDAARVPLRLGLPILGLDDAVRYSLLPLLAIGLGLGLLLAKDAAPTRIAAAFSPFATSLDGVSFIVTITPPDYAAAPPQRIALAGGAIQKTEALPGSKVSIRAEGLADSWSLERSDGSRSVASGGKVDARLTVGGTYRMLWDERTAARLKVQLAADGVPVIRLTGTPTQTASGAVRFAYRLTDDHGASALSIRLQRGGKTHDVDLDVRVQSGQGHVFADLTPDVWAGETVDLELLAKDGAGNVGATSSIRVELPQRPFRHPLARKIIDVRRDLLSGKPRTPLVRKLSTFASDPGGYDGDLSIFIGLRSAGWRLVYDRRLSARLGAGKLLWDIAIDLEDGGASRAMDDLRAAMDRLSKGLDEGDDRVLAALSEQLEAAMSAFLRQQIEAAMQAGDIPEGTGDMSGSVDLGFLDQMFADLKDRMAAGDKAGAAKALSNLRQLMENIRFGGTSDPQAVARARAAADIARAFRDIEETQNSLREETTTDVVRHQFQHDEDDLPGRAEEQAALQKRLAELRKQMADADITEPVSLDAAETAMGEAARALSDDDGGGAIRAQTRALEALDEAARSAENTAQRLAQMAGPGASQPGAAGAGLDPLGRPGAGFGQGAVKLPDEAEVRRIQAIRKILEDRANDPSRSGKERGYYLRLLKRF